MSKSGSGRGRGWLNIKPNNQNVSPVIGGDLAAVTPTTTATMDFALPEELEFSDYKDVHQHQQEHTDLVNTIKQLSVYDDGIVFNQKIKFILDNWRLNCQTAEEIEQSFDTLYQSCLNDADLATKLVTMIASRTFITQEVHDKNIRLLFLRKLQNNFDSSKSLRKTNHIAFRNSVRLLGEFYNKARLANGQQLTFLATPLLSYLEMLLEDAQLQDVQLFTTQLYLNGSTVKTELPDKFTELLNTVRSLLVSDKNLTREGKLWLLLALEVANNRFSILPAEISKFYKDHLGDTAIANFQGTPSTLSVQTMQENKTLDNYQSNVSVLQLSSPLESTNDLSSSSIFSGSELNSHSLSNSSGFVSDISSQNCNHKDASNKHGRPILGAGARLGKLKPEVNDEGGDMKNNSNWRERDNSANMWNNKPKGGDNWRENKKNMQARQNVKSREHDKPNKGWEHDDRFETNYS